MSRFFDKLAILGNKIADLAEISSQVSRNTSSVNNEFEEQSKLCLTDWNFSDVIFRLNETSNRVERIRRKNLFKFHAYKSIQILTDIYCFPDEGLLRPICYKDVATLAPNEMPLI